MKMFKKYELSKPLNKWQLMEQFTLCLKEQIYLIIDKVIDNINYLRNTVFTVSKLFNSSEEDQNS